MASSGMGVTTARIACVLCGKAEFIGQLSFPPGKIGPVQGIDMVSMVKCQTTWTPESTVRMTEAIIIFRG